MKGFIKLATACLLMYVIAVYVLELFPPLSLASLPRF